MGLEQVDEDATTEHVEVVQAQHGDGVPLDEAVEL